VPSALMTAALMLGDIWDDVARGIATVTANPAKSVGLTDRGALQIGLRADIVRIGRVAGIAQQRGLWVAGQRVA
jgi:alpha-D-ribose 1-methylphosphonate 5-triphosphate diphosphatase